ncbi:MAG: DNA-binding protein [Synergistaceae bacterium]|nr:DNA-binding protein [Synergistaceae bacterium]
MQFENSVTVSGILHRIKKEKQDEKYYLFAVKQETVKDDGSVRKDFLVTRVFIPEVAQFVRSLDEGSMIRVGGEIRVSSGSGEMYIYACNVEKI